MMPEDDSLLDLRGVAEFLAVSPRHALNLVDRGVLPEPIKLGRCSRWRRSDIQSALAELEGPQAGSTGRPRSRY